MRFGVGGGAFGVRGGISNRGIGVGAGPLSVGTSWRSSAGGSGFFGQLFGLLILLALAMAVVAWPFWLGSYIAVEVFDAGNPSVARSVWGWIFEVPYIVGVVVWSVLAYDKRATRREAEARRLRELEESGVVYELQPNVYRHGVCTINHRSIHTAERCRVVADAPPLAQAATRKCPDCAETVLVDAKVCKHCGFRFVPAKKLAPSAKPVPAKKLAPSAIPKPPPGVLARGASVKVMATDDEHQGQIGVVHEIADADEDGLDVLVTFKGDKEEYVYAFSRDELKIVIPQGKAGAKK
jgi:hypothetical protein